MDEETKLKVLDILRREFDVEIKYKEEEIHSIFKRLEKAETLLEKLKLCTENGMAVLPSVYKDFINRLFTSFSYLSNRNLSEI
jgi:hypothetical protein